MTYPDYSDPKVAKAIRKAQRPWYQKKRFLIPLVLVAFIFVGAVVSAIGADPASTTQNRPGTPSGVDASGYDSAVPGGPRLETWTSPGGGAPHVADSGPLTSFSDGTYEVGTGDGQVAPGKYKSSGPESAAVGVCYSARLKNNDGELGDILDNDVSQGPGILNVKSSDGYVEVSGCTFTKA